MRTRPGSNIARGLLALLLAGAALILSVACDVAPVTVSESTVVAAAGTPASVGTVTTRGQTRRRPTPTGYRSTLRRTPVVGLTPTPATAGLPVPSPTLVRDQAFEAALAAYLGEQEGEYGVAVRSLDTGQMASVSGDEPFPSASTYKLLVMYVVFRQLEQGGLALDDTLSVAEEDMTEDEPEDGLFVGQTVTVRETLRTMIEVSSNYAAMVLVRTAGGWPVVDEAAAELRMTRTFQGEEYFQTTPSDMLGLLESLARGELVSKEASTMMYGLLLAQTHNDRIPSLLPPEATVAHKTGEMDGVRNDVGIVRGPGGSFVISLFSRNANEEIESMVLAEVARRAYDRYAAR